ncbi:HlyD family secretion protein [Clostridium sp. JS66]|uniref:HlyD family secretion protein n=1 Tax=Clostridium sp. JS66 TaxID=3064705 RepID=UPI00298EAEDE|nr:efflux RND transporter periplasmic adaptor subunit [Clostridium sp. JS66]WPC43894.1 efflux RND transporter periplasmic adaptor subunit [Clostridium sp. JS66]
MKEKRKLIILVIFVTMLITLGSVGYYYWHNNTYYISSEDAKVSGDFVKILPEVSGKLVEFNVKEGDKVVKNQIIGRIDAVGLDDSSIDESLLRAPMDGVIIKKQANVGEYELSTSAPTLAMVVDPSQLYVTANIEESKVENIKLGQQVDINFDEFKEKDFKGKVDSIGKASNSAFSMLPSSSSGTFTKVVQKVPVKIKLDKTDGNLLPGTNAVIKIHIK